MWHVTTQHITTQHRPTQRSRRSTTQHYKTRRSIAPHSTTHAVTMRCDPCSTAAPLCRLPQPPRHNLNLTRATYLAKACVYVGGYEPTCSPFHSLSHPLTDSLIDDLAAAGWVPGGQVLDWATAPCRARCNAGLCPVQPASNSAASQISVCVYVCMHECTHVCALVCMHVYAVCMYVWMQVCTEYVYV